jgi:hypothetical protein
MRAYDARSREDLARAARAYSRPQCPACGCTGERFCVLALDGGGLGACAIVPGHDGRCSGCLTPERRVPRGRWFAPPEEEERAMEDATSAAAPPAPSTEGIDS